MRPPFFGPGGPFEHEHDGGPRGHRGPGGGPDGPRGRGGPGRGGWGGPPPGPPRGPRGHRDHDHDDHGPGFRGRTRRGEIRTGLLAILAEGPGHGYELIQRIEEKTGGAWKPSPGSVYPTLQMLQDEGMVTAEEADGKRTFSLTEAGRAESERRTAEFGDGPWSRDGRSRPPVMALFEGVKTLHLAARQVGMAGNPEQITAATAIIVEARKKLYQLLAAD